MNAKTQLEKLAKFAGWKNLEWRLSPDKDNNLGELYGQPEHSFGESSMQIVPAFLHNKAAQVAILTKLDTMRFVIYTLALQELLSPEKCAEALLLAIDKQEAPV